MKHLSERWRIGYPSYSVYSMELFLRCYHMVKFERDNPTFKNNLDMLEGVDIKAMRRGFHGLCIHKSLLESWF